MAEAFASAAGDVASDVSSTRWRRVQSIRLNPMLKRSSGPGVTATTRVPDDSTLAIPRLRAAVARRRTNRSALTAGLPSRDADQLVNAEADRYIAADGGFNPD